VNQSELVQRTAGATSGTSSDPLTKSEVGEVIKAAFDQIFDALAAGEEVQIPGLGKFVVNHQNARAGVNPQTGEKIEIAARNVVKFKPSSTLKQAVG